MAQNPEALAAYKYLRGLLQEALQDERAAWHAVVQAHALKARGEGPGPTDDMHQLRDSKMRAATSMQHELDLLAQKHWG